MRTSQAALALITRINSFGLTEYLTQWNNGWHAYSLIGGHVDDGETFRECCIREVCEEVHCGQAEVDTAPYPYATLRFRDFSRAAKVETDYHWQVFLVRVGDGVIQRLPADCAWVAADRIRARFTTAGKPIAEQVYRVLQAVENAEFDLFVSYGHADTEDGSVTALVEHIRQEHAQFAPNEPLKIFFDLWRIRDGDDWQHRIYRGLIESKTMLAVLSPAYFASEWCRREFDTFVTQQKKITYPGDDLIHAIYIHQHSAFESDGEHPQREWFEALKRKQFLDAKPWWPDGRQALQRDVVASRLKELREQIWERVCDARHVQHSPTNLRDFNLNFVGREHELTQLWNTLRLDHAVAVSAIQGVGGLGKTALARAYAHTRRRDYPGGQFEIAMEQITSVDGLKFEIIRLANDWLSASIPDELINSNLPAAFEKARAAFERPGQGKILLILDNVASDGLLSDRSRSLPSSEHVHVLATTRLDPERWGIQPLRLEQLSTADALDLFLKYRPFQIPDERQWHQARQSGNQPPSDAPQPADTDEWKAALGIVNRLGGHALAIEVVAVYLGNHRSISLQDYLGGMIRKGTTLKLDQAGDDPNVRARLAESIETNIAELLKPTFEKLESENPLAMRALEWAASLPPDHVPWVWLRELVGQDHGEQLQHDSDDPDPWQDGVVPLLSGWQLLTGDEDQPTARMHRIVQAAIVARSERTPSTSPPDASGKLGRLLNYLTDRAEALNHQWGRPGVNWELTPHFEAVQLLLPELGLQIGSVVDRLMSPLEQAGCLKRAIELLIRLKDAALSHISRDPFDENHVRNLSLSFDRLGRAYKYSGDLDQALKYYQRSHQICKQLKEFEPKNVAYDHDLSCSCERLGDMQWALGNLRKALKYYRKSLRIRKRLLVPLAGNTELYRDVHSVLIRIGDAMVANGDAKKALQDYEDAMQIASTLYSSDPMNVEDARSLVMSQSRIADVLDSSGHYSRALEYRLKALEISEHLAECLPENSDCARDLSITHGKLGDIYAASGDTLKARDHYEKSTETCLRRVQDAPDNSRGISDLARAYNKVGILLSSSSEFEHTREFFKKSLDCSLLAAMHAPLNAYFSHDLYLALWNMGCAEAEAGEPVKAQYYWRRAHDILQGMVDRGLHVSPEDLGYLQQIKQIIDGESQ